MKIRIKKNISKKWDNINFMIVVKLFYCNIIVIDFN